MQKEARTRRLPVGAEVQRTGGVHFRVWAPRRKRVDVMLDAGAHALAPEAGGYFSGHVAAARAGALYRYRLDGGDAFPDPASRFQPEGPHGPSEVIDPEAFAWSDAAWRGRTLAEAVIYEIHIGTFTREGSWAAAMRELPRLAEDGITVVEVMPVADFCGRFGWGYDGVDLYAPTRLYGRPDDMRRFVDRAHALGVAVILDVVYNHFGPDGAYHREFAKSYFSDRYENEWGDPINFDGPDSGPVREFFIENAAYWIREFHLDGLRLDATQQIFDASPRNVMQEVTERAREAAPGRATLVIAENEPQLTRLVRPAAAGGYGMDALWNDDFHHAASVALIGAREAYCSDYLGSPQEFVSAAKWGYLYQGQHYAWQKGRRGSPALDLPARAFVTYIENHDQLANTAFGSRRRLQSSPGRYRALNALMLLSPAVPMLFQGQEFGAASPFLFFADHKPDLARAVREGRAQFMTQFRGVGAPDMEGCLPDPGDPRTFEACKLDFERDRVAEAHHFFRDLLRLRREDPPFGDDRCRPEGAVIGAEAFVLRALREDGDRLLVVNLGTQLHLVHVPEPLLAPPAGTRWSLAWSSEDPRYGGCGTADLDTDEGWRIPGQAAVLLQANPSP